MKIIFTAPQLFYVFFLDQASAKCSADNSPNFGQISAAWSSQQHSPNISPSWQPVCSMTDEHLFPPQGLFPPTDTGRLGQDTIFSTLLFAHHSPLHTWAPGVLKGKDSTAPGLPRLSAGTFQHETCRGWKPKKENGHKSWSCALRGNLAKPRTTEMTDGPTVVFVLGYFL